MADELNTPNHRYYQPQNNILLAANEVSKQFILASGIAKIDAKIINPLFALAEPGAWYDPSDLTTLFQDSAGTTPVTAAGQTVGLMLDKSQGLTLGSELVTNGDFATDTAWTKGAGWTISGGTLNAVAVSSQTYQFKSFTVGAVYEVSLNILSLSGGTVTINIGGDADFVVNTPGLVRKYLRVPSVSVGAIFISGTGFTGSIDNISIKLLAGNHATQATSTQRPTYGINPIVGTRNLLTFTEQFDNAAWSKIVGATVSANTTIAPDGTLTADTITFNTTNGNRIEQSIGTALNGETLTYSLWMKGSGTINLNVGTDTGVGGASETTFTLTSSWVRYSVSVTLVSPTGLRRVMVIWRTGNTATNVDVWGAQLELGSTATAYQKVVSQYEVTQAGVQSASYLAFDGVDDGMVTNTITPNIDKVQVFAGVRKLSNSVAGVIAELSSAFPSNNGVFQLTADGGNLPTYLFGSKGTVASAVTVTPYVSPITNVVTGIGDIAVDNATIRVNGTATSSTTDQGTGNYLAYPLYIGRRGGSTLPFNGRIYSLITRFGANLTDGQITSTESWVNSKVGAY